MTDWIVPLLFGGAASATTVLGGMVALRFADRIAGLLAIASGVVLGVAFFDLLPDAITYGDGTWSHRAVLSFCAVGLAAYLVLARGLATASVNPWWRAHLGPASLTMHSLLDGIGLGVAFNISPEIGWLVAAAVLTHDLADGVNTVSLALEGTRRAAALRWLALNGAAPLVGVLVGLSLTPSPAMLAPITAMFAGVFIYIGAVELVPRSLARDQRMRTTGLVLAGIALMFCITLITG